MRKNFTLGIIMCLLATMSWGGMFPIMQVALKKIDPFYFTALRYGSASVVFAIILLITEGKKSFQVKGNKLKLFLLGTLGFAGFNFLVFLGQKLAGNSGAIIASIMMGIQPLLAVIFNWILNNKKPNKLTLILMLTALLGVVLVITKGDINIVLSNDFNILSVFVILLGACCWVLYTLGSSYFPDWSPVRYTTLTALFGCISIAIIVGAATTFGVLSAPTINTIGSLSGPLAYMSLLAGVVAALCWNGGNKLIGNINAILFMNVVPLTAFVISVINGYHLYMVEIIGVLLIITSLTLNNINNRKQLKKIILNEKGDI